MKRIKGFALCASAVLLAAVLAGCNGKGAGDGKNESVGGGSAGVSEAATDAAEEISCAEILDRLLEGAKKAKCDAKTVYGDGSYEGYFDYLYEIKPDKASDGAFGYASASYADEISVIMMADENEADMFLKKLDERVARRIRDFEGYKPEETEKLGRAQSAVSGKYVILAVCDGSDKVIEEFQRIMGEK
ncbi:MAG: DUF4358 domain-containing protein [Butyrivibrio sp.]|nr:DUF4358 domain-containing protein [Butyrivibrio sp.]